MLERITRSVKDIESMNDQIACAAQQQQDAAGEEISRNVINVRDISDQTAGASERTASSSMELARIGVMPAREDHPLQGLKTPEPPAIAVCGRGLGPSGSPTQPLVIWDESPNEKAVTECHHIDITRLSSDVVTHSVSPGLP